MKRDIRFAIVGLGHIARKFATALQAVEGASLQAVAARDERRARDFAGEFGAKRVYASYAELFADPDVDVVYVAVINSRHFAVTKQALEAGKSCLVEKPFMLNGYETDLILALAARRQVFLMEAMWTRFHPLNRAVLNWLKEGKIGPLRRLEAAFGYFGGSDEKERHLDPAQGGGALLDVGIYPLAYASMLLGQEPHSLTATALTTRAGVDRQIEIAAAYENSTATLAASVTNALNNGARLFGTTGVIDVPRFFNPLEIRLSRYGEDQEAPLKEEKVLQHQARSNGYEHEIEAVRDALRQDWKEHPFLTWQESRSLMVQLDRLRERIGLFYPAETAFLFDCDGVLVDSEPALAVIAAHTLNRRGLPARPQDFLPFIGVGEDRYLGGVMEQYGQAYDPTVKAELYARYVEEAPELVREVPGAKALLLQLKELGYRVAVASSADAVKVACNLAALGLEASFFDAVITGSDVDRKKPWPDIYLKTAEEVGVTPENCFVIEDAAAGIESGNRGQMTTIGITTALDAAALKAAGADHVIGRLGELLPLVEAVFALRRGLG